MIESKSTASLAYLGDAVFELYVRDMLVNGGERTLNRYNKLAKQYVAAVKQAPMYHKIFPQLTENEQAVIRRGRNLKTASRARSATLSEYHHATGLEALFGYLYITEQHDRLREVFQLCIADNPT